MARISGIDLPRDKRIEIALTYIYGIGRKTATDICAATGVNPDIRVRDLTEDDAAKLREYIDHNCRVEGDLRRDVAFDIKRLIEIGSYRGLRPVSYTHLDVYKRQEWVNRAVLLRRRLLCIPAKCRSSAPVAANLPV